jgi:hypothetical protein
MQTTAQHQQRRHKSTELKHQLVKEVTKSIQTNKKSQL